MKATTLSLIMLLACSCKPLGPAEGELVEIRAKQVEFEQALLLRHAPSIACYTNGELICATVTVQGVPIEFACNRSSCWLVKRWPLQHT
jgi:hypothetical protein